MDPLYALSGLVVGFCIGLTGVGGGALMTPLLVLGFGLPTLVAVGTDLVYAALTKASGVFFHTLEKTIHWPLVLRLAAGSLPATLTTLWWLDVEGHNTQREELITIALGVALVITSLTLLFKERLQQGLRDLPGGWSHWLLQHRDNLLIPFGALLGVLVTLSSVGAGALTAAVLFLLYPRLPAVGVVGTDLAHAVPLAAIAGFGHWQMGSVDLSLLVSLLLGSLPGTALGSQVGFLIPEHLLRKGLAGLLLIIGLKFAF
jgi:uncharacterized membrane protein YfcA